MRLTYSTTKKIGFGALTLILLLTGGISLYMLSFIRETHHRLAMKREKVLKYARINTSLINIDKNIVEWEMTRGLSLTPAMGYSNGILDLCEQLGAEENTDQKNTVNLHEFEQKIKRIKTILNTIITMEAQGESLTGATIRNMINRLHLTIYDIYIKSEYVINDLNDNIISEENKGLEAIGRAQNTLAVVIILGIFGALLTGYLTARALSHPITVLSNAMGQIAEGNISKRLDYQYSGVIGELLNTFDRMAQKVEDATKSNERIIGQLSQSNAELEEFSYLASHDLKEPLRKIMFFTERIVSRHGKNMGIQGQDYLSKLKRAAIRLEYIINEFVEYTRILTEGNPFIKIDLNDAVQEAMAELDEKIIGASATVEVCGKLPEVEADPEQIVRLLYNLIENSLKFSRKDVKPQIAICAEIVDPSLDKTCPNLKGSSICRLKVSDNGIGIEEEYFENIFGLFQRLNDEQEYSGNGMGLAICRKIVRRHGGQISLESQPGNGTTFTVLLPVYS